jgi:PAS domain S-box-containing protein
MNSDIVNNGNMVACLSDLKDFTDFTDLNVLENSPLSDAAAEAVLKRVTDRIDAEPAKVTTDENGWITSINPAFSKLCGYRFDEIQGKKPGSLLQGPQTTAESIDSLRQAIRTQTPCMVEMVNYHKDQSIYQVKIDLRPLHSESGELTGFEAREWKL